MGKTLTKREKWSREEKSLSHELPCLPMSPGQNGDENCGGAECLSDASTEDIHPKPCLKQSPSSLPKIHSDHSIHVKSMPSDKSWKKPQSQAVSTLPPYVWKIIAQLYGIRLKSKDKPWLATILYILTVASTFTFIVTCTWFIIYDVASTKTKRDALKGGISITLVLFWGLLVIYANKLGYRMFTHQGFVKNIRMHSKTLLKCNIAVLITICGFLFNFLLNYDAVEEFYPSTCEFVNLSPVVCRVMFISRIIFSFFAFLWNTLVAIVVLSVCRTHALQIRHFIRELERDALAHDESHRRTFSTSTFLTNVSSFVDDSVEVDDDIGNDSSSDEKHDHKIFDVDNFTQKIFQVQETTAENDVTFKGGSFLELTSVPYLKPPEILHRYWKLQCSLRLSSSAFKRWLICFMSFCIIWTGICLIKWLTVTPTVLDVFLFLIPLIWFPIVTSAIAEVNNEGQRMLRFICPTEDRLRMLMYLNEVPLQMAIYGFSIKYSTVVTTLFGLMAALMSGVVLQEIKRL